MKLVVQRVKNAKVVVEGNVVGEFGLYKRKPKVYDKILRKGFTKIKDIFE